MCVCVYSCLPSSLTRTTTSVTATLLELADGRRAFISLSYMHRYRFIDATYIYIYRVYIISWREMRCCFQRQIHPHTHTRTHIPTFFCWFFWKNGGKSQKAGVVKVAFASGLIYNLLRLNTFRPYSRAYSRHIVHISVCQSVADLLKATSIAQQRASCCCHFLVSFIHRMSHDDRATVSVGSIHIQNSFLNNFFFCFCY